MHEVQLSSDRQSLATLGRFLFVRASFVVFRSVSACTHVQDDVVVPWLVQCACD
jgi:hypothetical protein